MFGVKHEKCSHGHGHGHGHDHGHSHSHEHQEQGLDRRKPHSPISSDETLPVTSEDDVPIVEMSSLLQTERQSKEDKISIISPRSIKRKVDCILLTDESFQHKLKQSQKILGKLYMVTAICFMFMIFEFIGGYISNSVAIMTDAAHMLSDVAGFFISILSIYLGQKPPTQSRSYGFHRTEVLGALTSIIFIWILVIGLIWEATSRVDDIWHHKGFEIDAKTMMITAFVSLVCNIINLWTLGHCCGSHDKDNDILGSVQSVFKPHGGHNCGHDHSNDAEHHDHHDHHDDHDHHEHDHDSESTSHSHGHENKSQCSGNSHNHKEHDNINLKAAIVHLIGDVLQSVGVIIASIVIYFKPDYKIIDPICTYLFSAIVMYTTLSVFKECYAILMESTPADIRTDHIREDILGVEGVENIVDFHCWVLSGGKNFLTAHIALSPLSSEGGNHSNQIRKVHHEIMLIINQHDICHTTLQIL